MSHPVFITATGPGIGKTMVACLLVGELRRRGRHVGVLKPVVSGFDDDDPMTSDPARLALAAGYDPLAAIPMISPWCFAARLSPDMAASREGETIEYGDVLIFCERTIRVVPDWLFIEGVGGVMSPLGETRLNRDLIRDLGQHRVMPVLLVAGSGLGAVTQALAAIEALVRIEAGPDAVILSESSDQPVPLEETAASIARHWSDGPIVLLPHLDDETEWTGALDPVVDLLVERTRKE